MLHALHRIDPMTNNRFKISSHWLRDFLIRYPDIRNMKSSSMDVTRAKKATADVRDKMFSGIDAMVERLHKEHQIPFATFADWPEQLKYG